VKGYLLLLFTFLHHLALLLLLNFDWLMSVVLLPKIMWETIEVLGG
jgi:hypothetical protein